MGKPTHNLVLSAKAHASPPHPRYTTVGVAWVDGDRYLCLEG
jgi:hypothetical protein